MATKRYKLTDSDSGETYVVSLPNKPTEDQATQIISSLRQQKTSLAQADEASRLFTRPALQKAALDVGRNIPQIAGSAIMTGAAPEFGIPMMVKAAYDAARQGYRTYQDPSTINKTELAGTVAQSLLPLAGGIAKFSPRTPSSVSGFEAYSRPETPGYGESAAPQSAPSGTYYTPPPNAQNVNSVPSGARNITPQISTPVPKQLTPGTTQTGPGEVSQSGITVTQPELSPSRVGGRFAKQSYPSSGGKVISGQQVHTPEIVNRVQAAAKKIQEKLNGPQTQETPQKESTNIPRQSESITNQKPKIENEWMRQTETPVLQTMRSGASGDLASEIDQVLTERGVQSPALPKVSEKSQEGPRLNEQAFKDYSEILSNLPAHGNNVGSHVLRDVAKLGKDSGLDKVTIKNDILENLHPETKNQEGRTNIAIMRAFKPAEEQ